VVRQAHHESAEAHRELAEGPTYPMGEKTFSNLCAEIFAKNALKRWITLRREFFSEISFVKTQAALEPSRSNHQLRYIPTIVSRHDPQRHSPAA
jgi:hypothetical protein